MPRSTVTEARDHARVTATEAGGGRRQRIELLTPGWGSSGYYSPQVLEAAGAAGVFPAGLHMHMDHRRGDGSMLDVRGNRSVRDLAAVLAETAVWDPTAGVDGIGALVADATVFGPYQELLCDPEFAEAIGVSVVAEAEVEIGTAEGRRGTIVTELIEARAVDYVTRAGRGGRIVQILESAGHAELEESRNIGQWMESRIHRDFTVTADDMAGEGRLTREERIGLSSAIGDALAAFVSSLESNEPQLYTRDLWDDPTDTAATAVESPSVRRAIAHGVSESTAEEVRTALEEELRETYGGQDQYVWVRDFDDATVWFCHETPDESGLYAQGYTLDAAGTASLTGERTEVRAVTTYVPVTRPGEPQEESMPEIAESELTRLREADGRVQTLESENSTLTQRAETAESRATTVESENAQLRARDAAVTHARTRVTEANGELPQATVDRIVATSTTSIPLTESGQLDTAALDTAVDAARTAEESYLAGIAESTGAGRIRSFGQKRQPGQQQTGGQGEVSESDVEAMIRRRAGTEQKGA